MILPNANAPYYFDYANQFGTAVQNADIHVTNTGLSRFFQRYLLQRAISVFDWKIPDSWADNYFKYVLYCFGYCAIINTDKFGVIPQQCGLGGYTVQYQPADAIVASPFFKQTIHARIDKDCVLLRLQPDYGGIMDIITHYADLMALTTESAATNLLNTKLAYVFAADRKAVAESFKKLFDDVASGKPAVVIDKDLLREDGTPSWLLFNQNIGQTYIADKLLIELRKINDMFDTLIGIPNANTDKRERLITDEVQANNFETQALAGGWLKTLQRECRKASDMFGIELSVDWSKDLKKMMEGVVENNVDESESSGNIPSVRR